MQWSRPKILRLPLPPISLLLTLSSSKWSKPICDEFAYAQCQCLCLPMLDDCADA